MKAYQMEHEPYEQGASSNVQRPGPKRYTKNGTGRGG